MIESEIIAKRVNEVEIYCVCIQSHVEHIENPIEGNINWVLKEDPKTLADQSTAT